MSKRKTGEWRTGECAITYCDQASTEFVRLRRIPDDDKDLTVRHEFCEKHGKEFWEAVEFAATTALSISSYDTRQPVEQ